MFYGNSCPMTKKVEPIVERVENKLHTSIKRLEVYENEENLKIAAATIEADEALEKVEEETEALKEAQDEEAERVAAEAEEERV